MADPPSHEEGDVKIIKPTWNVENVVNTLKCVHMRSPV